MITRGRVAVSSLLLLSVSTVILASLFRQVEATPPSVSEPKLSVAPDVSVSVSAAAFLVLDVATREIITEYDPGRVLPIASVTKLPAAVGWQTLVPEDATTTILWADVVAEGRAGKLQYGDVYTNHDLLFPLLLESSNDAAAAMERVTEDELVAAMNEFAGALSLTSTEFVDASGLSPQNVSTAAELATLITHLKDENPHVFDITTLNQYLHEETGWVNNSPFSNDNDYVGGKHGFTYEANRTAVAFFEESFTAGNREILYVVLGSDDLKRDVDDLRQFVRESVRYE